MARFNRRTVHGSRSDALSAAAGAVFAWLREVVVVQGTKIGEEEVQSKTREQYDDQVEEAVTGLVADVESSSDDDRMVDDGKLPPRQTRASKSRHGPADEDGKEVDAEHHRR